MTIQVFSFRVKDATTSIHLNQMARSVNYVWNYCNDVQRQALKWRKKWPSGFDLNKLTSGVAKELSLHSQTVQAIGQEYALRRKQFNKPYLRWRSKRSLGWVPFKASGIKIKGDCVNYAGKRFRFWRSQKILGKIKCGSFSQDARGRWYINIACEVTSEVPEIPKKSVGIDLGLKTLAALSSGKDIPIQKEYRKLESELAGAQRAKKKKQIQSIHAKITNRRKDYLHKQTTLLVSEHGLIVVGNVSAKNLAKTKMAKSVYDASWSTFRNLLKYKSERAEVVYIEVNEANTSRTCFVCGEIPDSSPKGLKGLGLREWVCECGSVNDRDRNAALNILRLGHQTLALK